jgi:NAD(P)-dependent dehydrogenase (short-subunit alcohol dehydrogenase family)
MGRFLVTGSTDGIGLATVQALVAEGHEVVAHARSADRLREVSPLFQATAAVLVGDLARPDQVLELADAASRIGPFDAVIHNAGIGATEQNRIETTDGNAHVIAINALAPYVLISKMEHPGRLVSVTSGMHMQGDTTLDDIRWTRRPWDGMQAYADSKLLLITVAFAVARLWSGVPSNAVDPGWVPTKMARGQKAPDDLSLAHVTQVWLATSDDPDARATGRYLHHQHAIEALPITRDPAFQDRVLSALANVTGVDFPR